MLTKDFFYPLPEALIAQRPLAERSASRLLVLDRYHQLHDEQFTALAGYLRAGDLLVINNTEVMPARLFGRKATGGQIEVLIERLLTEHEALAQVRASKAPKAGTFLVFSGDIQARVTGREGSLFKLQVMTGDWHSLLDQQGHMPLPPYIHREDDDLDQSRYQTVFASRSGAVAAPTAGLHFDQPLLDRIRGQGIDIAEVTLHVGAGTFQPVRAQRIEDHQMHAERVTVSRQTCDQVLACQHRGGRVIAVGTTSVRSLESAAQAGDIAPFDADTRLFITPGYEFRVVDAMVTNFHLPESSLLMLVAAFAGYEPMMAAYRHAIAGQYRFFSYGDAMLIEKPEQR
ncbi:MAG TPA: tRNA preQ1(34) S-adenosylmethionine ribosyltransferase-isomerase QueA [Gammaproteobacteria bacterium]|nr:tRNA preQ1(34) S-adenosylmethionine ribosyltransferase-isomerase QueA [Gammaproteobacteria bacterium]